MNYKVVKKRKLFKTKYYFKDNHDQIWGAGYDYADDFKEGFARVRIGDKFYFLDDKKFALYGEGYDEAWSFDKGLALVKKNGKYHFINKDFVLSEGFDKICNYSEQDSHISAIPNFMSHDFTLSHNFTLSYSVARVKNAVKMYFMHKRGQLPCERYDKVWSFDEGLALVQKNGKYHFIDKDFVLSEGVDEIYKYEGAEDKYTSISHYFIWSHNVARVKNEGKMYFMDKKGQLHGEGFDYISHFHKSFAAVLKNGKYYFIDLKNFEIHGDGYDKISLYNDGVLFNEGATIVKKDGKYYFVDEDKGECHCEGFEEAWGFNDGYAPVLKDGKCYYVDNKKFELHGDAYDKAWEFCDGYAMVEKDGIKFRINKNFEIPTTFECLEIAKKDVSKINLFPLKFFLENDFIEKLLKIVKDFFDKKISQIKNANEIKKIEKLMSSIKDLIELKKKYSSKLKKIKNLELAKENLKNKQKQMFTNDQNEN